MPAAIPLIAATGIGAVATLATGEDAEDAAHKAGASSDAAEMRRFEEAKRQAEILRQTGDEAAAVALEEAVKAEIGAQKFEALSNQYAQQVENAARRREQIATDLYTDIKDQAIRKEQIATDLYGDIRDQATRRDEMAMGIYDKVGQAADARQAAGRGVFESSQQAAEARERAGLEAQSAILQSQNRLDTAAQDNERRQLEAFGNIESRFSPFMDSERRSISQLDVEMGLRPGDQYKGYRDTPAYMAAQDASRVAEQEAIGAIDTAAGNTGTLYSGTRGAALLDRAKRGSYERAGIEQNYYQNYMNMLQGMANPASTGAVSNFEAAAANNIGSNYMNAAGTGVNSAIAAQNARLGTLRTGDEGAGYLLNTLRTGDEGAYLMDQMRTGEEGAYLMDQVRTGDEGAYLLSQLNPGDAGASYALGGMDMGTAGSPYRLQGQNYRLTGAGASADMTLGNMPTGMAGNNYRLLGTEAQSQAMADTVGGLTNMYTAYMQYGRKPPVLPPANAGNEAWSNFYGS